jgi:TRAP transporter TAXI family solute receptor
MRRVASIIFVVLASAAASMCNAGAGHFAPVSFVTGSTGSDWYRIGSAIALHTNARLGGHPVTAVPGAGGISNPARVGLMPGDFGVSFLPFLRLAFEGSAPYKRPYPDLRHVASLIPNAFHLIVSPTLGLASIEDIKRRQLGVRIGTGPSGSGEELLIREALAAHGITYDDIRRWGGRIDLLGSGERADLYRDNHIDLIVFNSNPPSSVITELLMGRPAVFLPVDDDTRRTLADRWHVRPMEIGPDVYPQQGYAVRTVGMTFGIFTTVEMPDELVYAMTAAIASQKTYLETVHAGFKGWQPQDMADNGGTVTHPGALKYYRERGWVGQ